MKRVSANYLGTINHPPYSPEAQEVLRELRSCIRGVNRSLRRFGADYRIELGVRGRKGRNASPIVESLLESRRRGRWGGPQMVPLFCSSRVDIYLHSRYVDRTKPSKSEVINVQVAPGVRKWLRERIANAA